MKIWFFSTVSEFQRLDKVPLSETIADVINWISYDKVSGMYPRHWANEYTVTWITTPLVSQVVSNSLLSGDLIDSLAYRAFKIIFDVRALYVSFGEGCTMAGVQRLEWCLVSSPIFQQGFQCFTFVKNKKRTRIHVHCCHFIHKSVIPWIHFIKRCFSNTVFTFYVYQNFEIYLYVLINHVLLIVMIAQCRRKVTR